MITNRDDYEQGYENGESSHAADWYIVLDEIIPEDVDPVPTQVANYIDKLKAEIHGQLDEIDRLRAQIERDRSVIEAARAFCRPLSADARPLYRAVAALDALTPDEVNGGKPWPTDAYDEDETQ